MHNIHKNVTDVLTDSDIEVKSIFFGKVRNNAIKEFKKQDIHPIDKNKLRVKISQNFETVMVCYENDNFLLSRKSLSERFSQEKMSLAKDKKIKKIVTHGKDFYIVCCKDYDKELDIISSRESWNNKKDK